MRKNMEKAILKNLLLRKKLKNKNFQEYFKLIKSRKAKIRNVLDVGCGEGGFLKVCSRARIREIYGVDVSEYALGKARKIKNVKLKQINLEVEPLPFSDHTFDLVCAIDIVEHVANTDFLFSELFRVLAYEGLFFMTTENHGSLFDWMFSPFFPRHAGHINLQKASFWKEKFKDHGFVDIETKGILFHGFPPLLQLRNFLRKLKIPVAVKPIFFVFKSFTGTLVLFARK